MDALYFKIVDFTIKFSFSKTEHTFYQRSFMAFITKQYKNFLVEPTKKIDFTFVFYGEPELQIMFDKENKNELILTHYLCRIHEKHNTLYTHYGINQLQFEYLIKHILSLYLLPKNHGFFLHSSGVGYQNRGYLFIGKSGAGKSTTAQMLKTTANILTDDIIAIRKISHRFYCYQSIIHEKNWQFPRTNQKFRLHKVFVIHKANHFALKEIKDKELKLTKITKQLATGQPQNNLHFSLLVDLVNKTSFYNLYIKKNTVEFSNFFKGQILENAV